MKEKKGYVSNALERKDNGGITLVWGNDNVGLQHILKKRKETNQPAGALLQNLIEIINKGVLEEGESGRLLIKYKHKVATIEPKFKGKQIQILLTAYYDGGYKV